MIQSNLARAIRSGTRRPTDPPAGGPAGEPIVLELSPDQIEAVLRDAGTSGAPSTLLSGLRDEESPVAADFDEFLALAGVEERGLSRSLLAGLRVLACFPLDGGYGSVGRIARRLNMSPSAAHRYVSTLVAAGLLERNPKTRLYRLPPKLTPETRAEPDS